MQPNAATKVLLYTRHPFVGHGLAAVLAKRPDFELVACCGDLDDTLACLDADPADVMLIYLTSGISLSDLEEVRVADPHLPIALWGRPPAREFVLDALQLGIHSLLPGQASAEALIAGLRGIRNDEFCGLVN